MVSQRPSALWVGQLKMRWRISATQDKPFIRDCLYVFDIVHTIDTQDLKMTTLNKKINACCDTYFIIFTMISMNNASGK